MSVTTLAKIKYSEQKNSMEFDAESRRKEGLLMIILLLAAAAVSIVGVWYNAVFLSAATIAQNVFTENPELAFIVIPTLFLISAYICKRYAPNASGSGSYHVLSALRKLSKTKGNVSVEEYISPKIAIITIISSIICVLGGGALGREGPIIQISASIFLFIAHKARRFLPDIDFGRWIIAGAAAGLATAFNAPLAGIILIIEELSHSYSYEKFSAFQLKAYFAVIASGFIAQYVTGNYILFLFPGIHFVFEFKVYVVLLLVGISSGIVAWIMKRVIIRSSKWRQSVSGLNWYLFPILFGLLVALVIYHIGHRSYGPGVFLIQESLQTSHSLLGIEGLVGRFVNIISAVAAGCAGGILLPSLAIGANLGSVISELFLPLLDSRMFVIAGMAALLGAIIKAPLTSSVLVLEITNQGEFILPLLIASMVATWVLGRIDDSFHAPLKH